MHEVLFLNKNYWVARIMKPRAASMFIYHILEARVHWNFSFRAFHEIQFQEHFMKHEILSWNTFTLVLKFHFLISSSIKKLSLQRKYIFWQPKYRNSRAEVFCKKGVLENFQKFTGKHLCQSLPFNKVTSLSLQLYFKKRLWKRCFPVNFVKFLGP